MGVVLVGLPMLPTRRAFDASVGLRLSRERGARSLSLAVAGTNGWNNGPWTEMNTSTLVIGIFEALSLVR